MRILVTGGWGFLGSELVVELAKDRKKELYILDSFVYGYPKKLPRKKNIKDFIPGNLKSHHLVARTIERVRPEVIVHLAAYNTRPEVVGEFRTCVESNQLGTANILDACLPAKNRPRKIVFASCESVRNPASHHGISKKATEDLLQSVCPLLEIELVILRFSEIYGRSQVQSSKSLVNFLVDNMLLRKNVALFDVNTAKDYVHLSDAVAASKLAVAQPVSAPCVMDIGPGTPVVTKDLVEKLKTYTKYEGKLKYLEHPTIRTVDSVADPGPAKELLGFECTADFEVELKNLIAKRRKDLKWQM